MAAQSTNRSRVLKALTAEPDGLTREELGSRTGLSRPTIGTIVSEMKAEGLVVERSLPASGQGRPPLLVALAQPTGLVIGVDFGHGHITVNAADSSGTPLSERTIVREYPVDRAGIAAFEPAIEMMNEALRQRSPSEVLAVGVGVPAPFQDNSTPSSVYLPHWAFDVKRHFGRLLGDAWGMRRPFDAVVVDNDANLGALGEGLRGAAKDCQHYLYVKVSTGIGLGIVVNGSLYRGAHRAAGEWGHVVTSANAEEEIAATSHTDVPVRACKRCGRLDCLQNLASMEAIYADLQATKPSAGDAEGVASVLQMLGERKFKELGDLVVNEPERYRVFHQALTRSAMRLGHSLTDLVRTLDPQKVVIGGLLAYFTDAVDPTIRQILELAALPSNDVELEFVTSERVTSSEVDGAISLALEHVRARL